MLNDLKTALVTGACGGIGSEIVRRLRAADLAVYALSHREAELAAIARETGSTAVPLDVSDDGAVSVALSGIEPDVLINAPSITMAKPTWATDGPAFRIFPFKVWKMKAAFAVVAKSAVKSIAAHSKSSF